LWQYICYAILWKLRCFALLLNNGKLYLEKKFSGGIFLRNFRWEVSWHDLKMSKKLNDKKSFVNWMLSTESNGYYFVYKGAAASPFLALYPKIWLLSYFFNKCRSNTRLLTLNEVDLFLLDKIANLFSFFCLLVLSFVC